MGVKALGWGTTICHPCSSHLVTVYSSGQCEHVGDRLASWSKGWLIQTGQVQKSVWASSQRGMSVEGNHSESERAREGWGWMTLEQLFPLVPLIALPPLTNTRLFSKPIPDIRQLPLRLLLPLTTPCPSPGSCESCPGFSWCAALSAWQRGSGTNTPSSVSPEQRESEGDGRKRGGEIKGESCTHSERKLCHQCDCKSF